MDNQEQQHPSTEADETSTTDFVKNILLTVGGVVLVFAILVLMPMVFTYLSNGDVRP